MNAIRIFYDTYEKNGFDPFQVFEVTPHECSVLKIYNLRGSNITKGYVGDFVDTPDPYLIFQIKNTPNGKKRTQHIDNDPNPKWDEVFEFYLTPQEQNILEVKLMDANYLIDETMGKYDYDLSELMEGRETSVCFSFGKSSQINATLLLKADDKSDLRYSLTLCEDEKAFLKSRCKKVFQSMQNLLGDKAPKVMREVPIIGMLGSGGGFRAMVCLSGVVKALVDSGVFDCVTYLAGLSGSSWYISTLYSHPDFPQRSPGDLQQELKEKINHSPFSLITPQSLYHYLGAIVNKHMSGQPVSFTDFFGHMLGDTLLRKQKESKLSCQQSKLINGSVPMPLYTCLHVKKNVTAKVFQEWLEFSPYEVGIAKYGTFIRTEKFGSKLYLGRVVKHHPEFPLHYLQGVWGSAFCILFKQLAKENGRKDLAQLMRESESKTAESELDKQLENFVVEDDQDVSDDASDTSEDDETLLEHKLQNTTTQTSTVNGESEKEKALLKKKSMERRKDTQTSLWKGMLNNLFKNSWLDTCAGRAGMIHNPLRGLSINNLYPLSPFSPTTPTDDVEFKGIHEALQTDAKKLYLVDSGLTFNSPYPLLLRPQRGIDLYLSFDFSARPTDKTPPFKELLLAEKWANANKLLFPPIEIQAKAFAKEPVRECYIFKNNADPYCPIILHFVIINNKFREYKAPGVLRQTAEEIQFANFDIFDDPADPYSLFKFSYTAEEFEKLSQLMEFNTLNNLDAIKDAIAETIERKRNALPSPPISLSDITKIKLKFRSQDALRKLKAYVRSYSKTDLKVQSTSKTQVTQTDDNEDSSNEEYDTPEED